MGKSLLFIINVDWYFKLHWLGRARAAKNAGYEVHVATRYTESDSASILAGYGLIVHQIPLNRHSMNPLSDFTTYRCIRGIIKTIKPDLVHSITVKPNLYSGMACRFLKTPQVMSVTGLGRAFSSNQLKYRLSRGIIESVYRFSCKQEKLRVIFENDEDRALFERERLAAKEKLVLIPGAGVDLVEFEYLEESKLSQSEPLVVLFAARMLWDKGVCDLIDAVQLLRQRSIHIQLNVAGIIDHDNPGAIPESQILDWHRQGVINWLGQVDGMLSEFAKASVVALPTTYGEGVPRVLIEAAAVGRPIVATDVVGCRDIVKDGENGFLVKPQDPKQIAAALEKLLLSQDMRTRFGTAGRRLVESVFSQERVIGETLKIYKQLLI